jgi:hypothetical protein
MATTCPVVAAPGLEFARVGATTSNTISRTRQNQASLVIREILTKPRRARLHLLARRIAAAIDPADLLGARLVLRLFLSALIANNALVGFTGARRVGFWHTGLKAAPLALIAVAFRVVM